LGIFRRCGCQARSLNRPLGDGRVNFRHEADGLAQGRDDFAVVHLIVVGECSATAVFEPLLANLIAADVEVPDFRRDTFEVLAGRAALTTPRFTLPLLIEEGTKGWFVDVNPALFDSVPARAGEAPAAPPPSAAAAS